MKAQIFNFYKWLTLKQNQDLKAYFYEVILDSGFTILGTIDYNFNPEGYTALFLLAESHFAIHTFPEENKYYIELSSCNKLYHDRFISILGDKS
mgnify:CR=1 FL=1|tara:strand:- start:137 stop:418 length:282 start_codon:yes stop_codon:yes gene_type:complete